MGPAAGRTALADLRIEYELDCPYSTARGGVRVDESRYWFDEIAQANARLLSERRSAG